MSLSAATSARRATGGATLVLALTAATFLGAGPSAPSPASASASSVEAASAPVETHADGVRARRGNALYTAAPGQVDAGAPFVVNGSVTLLKGARKTPRLLSLLVREDGSWSKVASKRSTRKGKFRFVHEFAEVGTYGVRVKAARSGRLGVAVSPERTVIVVRPDTTPTDPVDPIDPVDPVEPTEPVEPNPNTDFDPAELPVSDGTVPAGSASDWEWLFPGGSRWNPCSVITWAYNPEGAYIGALDDMKRAFAIVSGQTGLRFKYVGPTGYVYGVDGTGNHPAVNMTVAWSNASESPELSGSVAGYGGGAAMQVSRKDVDYEIVEGFVVLDLDARLRAGFDTSGTTTWGQVMTHEVMHSMGLSHASGDEQLMSAFLSPLNHRFGAGDLTGLTKIGADAGCL